jgi:glycosyltransferase involved in cell wall biosynthesis
MFKASDKVDVPMHAVSNGIDLSRFMPGQAPDDLYKTFNLPRDKKIVSYIGRLDAEKHLWVLVEAFKILRESINDIHLMIVGSGTDEERLKRLVYQHGLQDCATFTGRVSDEEIVALHKVGTVYVMPSPAELQSIATLEAMASGQPVVAVDAGALRELCQDGRNGFLCEQDAVNEVAEGIRKIVTDSTRRDTYANESLAIARTHDLQTTLERFEALYSDLIKS